MKALITGITGNLGYEVCLNLAKRGITVVPCIRPGRIDFLYSYPIKFDQVVEYDLVDGDDDIDFSIEVDCIVHCAGVVHFNMPEGKNQQMMLRVVKLAKKLKVPIYAVSTAFVYKPLDTNGNFNNSYEEDKFLAEQILASSGVPWSILRPSVLTGNSISGDIQNFSGYYFMVRAFIAAVHKASEHKRMLRFPRMTGRSDMVPVDEAADQISKTVERRQLGEIIFITNSEPPRSEWLLDETLNFYGVRDVVNILDISFQEFGKLDLTEEELTLYKLASHFAPYWSMDYEFPTSVCKRNFIDHDYLRKILTVFHDREDFKHEQKSY